MNAFSRFDLISVRMLNICKTNSPRDDIAANLKFNGYRDNASKTVNIRYNSAHKYLRCFIVVILWIAIAHNVVHSYHIRTNVQIIPYYCDSCNFPNTPCDMPPEA